MKLDEFSRSILRIAQRTGSLSQKTLSQRVSLSPNACWHRVQAMKKAGIITGQSVRLDRRKLDLGLVVFVMIRTRHHTADWLETFRKHVNSIPEVIDFFRIGGEYDYLLKVVVRDMECYDGVYQRLISKVDLDSVTSMFAMETIAEQRPLPI